LSKKLPYISPLRYPGSKRKLVPYIEEIISTNNFHASLYIEPFVGGGSVALSLLRDNLVDNVILIDIDPWIISFWQTVFFDTDWLVEKILTTKVTVDNWNLIKHREPKTVREKAWTCFFLNRTSFSGLLEKKAGPLGGKNQNSSSKIDCRFHREDLITRILTISSYRERIIGLWCLSWEDGLSKVREEQAKKTIPVDNLLFYFDPPFFEKAENLYRYYFKYNDHFNLRDFIISLSEKWILSYDPVHQVETLYGLLDSNSSRAKKDNVDFIYSLPKWNKRRKSNEIVMTNFDSLPDFASYQINQYELMLSTAQELSIN
jgi:DNA adenine methylase